MEAGGQYEQAGETMGEKASHTTGASGPEEHDRRRRAAIKRLIAAGGVVSAAHWHKPVVDVVILPAHAQATTFMPPAGFTGSGSVTFTFI
jgi:hypothetical protein